MVTQSGGAGASTYMPEPEDLAEIVDIVAVLGARGIAVGASPADDQREPHRQAGEPSSTLIACFRNLP